jgi:hypothetical protein
MVNRVIEISLNILMAPEAVTDAININTKRMWRLFTLVISKEYSLKSSSANRNLDSIISRSNTASQLSITLFIL